MARTAASFVSEALSAWILARLDQENDFAREGLPQCDVASLLQALAAGGLPAKDFSLALVGFNANEAKVRASADAALPPPGGQPPPLPNRRHASNQQ